MAELKLLQENKSEKKLYKSWKLYAAAIGIIVIGLGVGLGVGLNVHHSSQTTIINLNTLVNKNIDGKLDMSQDDAYQMFIANNPNIKNLESNVTVIFEAPKYGQEGLLTITAKKANTKYTGEIKITINAIAQINLNQLLDLNTSIATIITNTDPQPATTAFNLFINNNQEKYPDLAENIEAGTFTLHYGEIASTLEINAKTNSKYIGAITVNFLGVKQSNIDNGFVNKQIQGTTNMTGDDGLNWAFQAFLNVNSSWSNLNDFVEPETESFIKPTTTTEGKLIVNTIPNTQWTGTITVTIKAIQE